MHTEDIKDLLNLPAEELKEKLVEMIKDEEKADIESQISVCEQSILNLEKSIENTKEQMKVEDCTVPMLRQGSMNIEVYEFQIEQYKKLKAEIEQELADLA
jgi:predicted unusual protein kinase regulating ubiquinone biosynthesis (AarF/ABC1/UbiB family)